ncbi:MAG: hypothetical protein Q4C80_07800 [Bacillota bacterium]|nr:hypothetical protein [Bacillota bacterium]
MLKLIKSHKHIALIFSLVLLIAIGAKSYTIATSYPDTGINQDGLSYGSAVTADTEESEPELIAAEATNGKLGYVLKTELQKAEGDDISNPNEAVAYMKAKDAKCAKAFSESISKQTDEQVSLTPEQYEYVVDSFFTDSQDAQSILQKLNVKHSKSQSSKIIQEALYAAQNANIHEINVYKKDGKTVIGVFAVN